MILGPLLIEIRLITSLCSGSKLRLDVCLVAHLNSNMNEETYMKLFKDWATIFIENGISNPKEIMNSVNKPWSSRVFYYILCVTSR